jgi:dTDP-4-dehydrorhamnose 3,5-epimerase
MIISPLTISGAYQVDLEPRGDERGWFSRLFCAQEFESAGLDGRVSQVNNSYSKEKGTLRGFHLQTGNFQETKLVRAISGAVLDVIVDLRPDSPTYLKTDSLELTSKNRKMIFVPRGCGHAILTLEEDTELVYLASQQYHGDSETGVRWNDPKIAFDWPIVPSVVSEKDENWPLL